MNSNTLRNRLDSENYLSHSLTFGDRQAGVSVVFCPDRNYYYYNAYCIERKLLKELFTAEFDFLDDALEMINDEFSGWKLEEFAKEKDGCGNCAAKKS